MDAFRWLSAQNDTYRMYWRGRHADDRMAMTGVALVMSGDARPDFSALGKDIEAFLARPGADVRLFGGLRFDLDRLPEDDWFGFPAWQFALPRFELHHLRGKSSFCCNLVFPEDLALKDIILDQIDELNFPEDVVWESMAVPHARTDNPGFEGWNGQVM